MKKILIFIIVIVMLVCTSCRTKVSLVAEGTFVSVEIGRYPVLEGLEYFLKSKYTIKEITKEEYYLSGGQNTFIDKATLKQENKRYMSVELYLFSIETQNYELANITGLQHRGGTPVYEGKFSIVINENIIEGSVGLSLETGEILNNRVSNHGLVCIYNDNFRFDSVMWSVLYPLLEGYGTSDEKYNESYGTEYFIGIKYSLKEITKEEYDILKSENVFIEEFSKHRNNLKYFNVEIYVLLKETNEYKKIDISNIKFIEGDEQIYRGEFNLNIDNDLFNYQIDIDYSSGPCKIGNSRYINIVIYNDDSSFSTYVYDVGDIK